MNITITIRDAGLTCIDGYNYGESNWLNVTEWTHRRGASESRDIAYQLSLTFNCVDDVDRMIQALTHMKESMVCSKRPV